MELLGEDGDALLCMTSTVSGPFGESMGKMMELVAERARAEMRDAIVSEMSLIGVGTCSLLDLSDSIIEFGRRVHALPVKP